MMQNPDYFERTRSRLHPKKYRFYFFDYLYYCGDRWSKRNSRVWGSGVIFNYWTFCIWGPVAFWTRLNGIHLFSESIDVTIVFAGMLLPFVCTRLRPGIGYQAPLPPECLEKHHSSPAGGVRMVYHPIA